MANAYQLYVGRPVSYLDNTRPAGNVRARWTAAIITAITSQTAVKLKYSGTSTAINSNIDVNKYTRAAGQVNVWKPY
jgi:hypothetical protein